VCQQLLYVDSLDVSGLNLHLPDGRFAVNIWSKEDIDTVLKADLQHDGKTYGKLEVVYVVFCMLLLLFNIGTERWHLLRFMIHII
jgi:hypothetical protein